MLLICIITNLTFIMIIMYKINNLKPFSMHNNSYNMHMICISSHLSKYKRRQVHPHHRFIRIHIISTTHAVLWFLSVKLTINWRSQNSTWSEKSVRPIWPIQTWIWSDLIFFFRKSNWSEPDSIRIWTIWNPWWS
jgi:hypothetical protein